MLSAISLMPFMMRFQSPPRADSLNHTPVPHVNNLPSELIGGKVYQRLEGEHFSMRQYG
jgi:hypothetical protein